MIAEPRRLKALLKKFNTCIPLFIAIGDECRQHLLLEIAQAGSEGINVSTLTETFHLSRPAISYHLKMLKDCGLIKPFKKGTQIFYSISQSKNYLAFKEVLASFDELIQQIEKDTSI